MKFDLAVMKLNYAVMKLNHAVMKFNHAVMKFNYAVMKFNYAVMKFDFAVMKFNYAVMKFNHAMMKFDLAVMKFDPALMKFDLVVMRFNLAVMKFNPVMIEFDHAVVRFNFGVMKFDMTHYRDTVTMLAKTWMDNARAVMERIENTQLDSIRGAATIMADSIAVKRWVHTFGCGHATLPVEEMYPRIGGFVGFHPMIELPLTYFTHITGEMGIHQFLFLERAEGFGREVMKSYDFDARDTMWIFSHSGLNPVNIDVAMEAKERGLKLVVTGSEAAYSNEPPRHSSGKKLFELADVVVDTCVPAVDASIPLPDHVDKVGPVSTVAFTATVWMVITTVAELLVQRGVKLFIHPSHNIPGDTTARDRLDAALSEYKRRIAGV